MHTGHYDHIYRIVFFHPLKLYDLRIWLDSLKYPYMKQLIHVVSFKIFIVRSAFLSNAISRVKSEAAGIMRSENISLFGIVVFYFVVHVDGITICIIGANVVRAHARFPCEGRRSGH